MRSPSALPPPATSTNFDAFFANAMTYHVARNNTPLGTFTREDVVARYTRGEIRSTDLVWTEGMTNWQPATQVLGAPAAPLGAAANGATARPPKPDSYLAWAILSTLLCFWPIGIVSIIYAIKVDSKYFTGDYAGAEEASTKAKTFAIISVVAVLVIVPLYLAFSLGLGMFSAALSAAAGSID
jgi:hypothetical protein